MIFTYKRWRKFCLELKNNGRSSIPACEVNNNVKSFFVLKHDVETNVKKAFNIARIEMEYGHRGSYYVQANLLNDVKNVKMLQQMQEMGHEISYHHDVLDSNKGDLDKAIIEYEKNVAAFENYGFKVETVCQHGNPVIERKGYNSNRDFFRSEKVQALYPEVSDIMVDFQMKKCQGGYKYFSDAGRKFKWIYDPINNDIVNSDDKNVAYKDANELLTAVLELDDSSIVSIHPHRWTRCAISFIFKTAMFKIIRFTAKLLIKIPFMKKFFSKYYHLAKKI